jgi:hypothetical protein
MITLTPLACNSDRTLKETSQLKACSAYPAFVSVPVVSQALYCPKPAGTWRLMAAEFAALPPLWPGFSTITRPDGIGAGDAGDAGTRGAEVWAVDERAVVEDLAGFGVAFGFAVDGLGRAEDDAAAAVVASAAGEALGAGAAVQPAIVTIAMPDTSTAAKRVPAGRRMTNRVPEVRVTLTQAIRRRRL